jgi:hypothetical protein
MHPDKDVEEMPERKAELVQIYRFVDHRTGLDPQEWSLVTWIMQKHLAHIQPDHDKYEYLTLMDWDQGGIGDAYYFAVLRHEIKPMSTAFTDGAGSVGPYQNNKEVMDYMDALHIKLADSEFATKISDEFKLPKPDTEAFKWFRVMLAIYINDRDKWQTASEQIKTILGVPKKK